MEDFKSLYQTSFERETEIKCYDQLTHEEISLHKFYLKLWHPHCMSLRCLNDEKYIINEALGRYCRKHNINVDHIFDINVLGELIPKKIKYGYLNVDKVIYSTAGTQVEYEIKDFIREIRNEIWKRDELNQIDCYWFEDKK